MKIRGMNVELVPGSAEWFALLEREASASAAGAEFARLVERQSRFAFRVAYAVVRNAADAEDVVQDVFFKLLRSGAWRQMADERAFLARAVWRLAVTRYRSQRSDCELPELESPAVSPESSAMAKERVARIHRLVDALPEKLRRPLALASIEGMTALEIAAVMEMPEGSVRRLLSDARTLVKEKLARMEGGPHER